jgi:hypothetical protein
MRNQAVSQTTGVRSISFELKNFLSAFFDKLFFTLQIKIIESIVAKLDIKHVSFESNEAVRYFIYRHIFIDI